MIPNEQQTVPPWVENLVQKYSDAISHGFILAGNVTDYVVPGVPLKNYLTKLFLNRHILVFYNRAEGFHFPRVIDRTASSDKDIRYIDYRARMVGALHLDGPKGNVIMQQAGLLEEEGPHRHDPSVALMLITQLLRLMNREKNMAAVVIDYAETLFPATGNTPSDRNQLVTALEWGRDNLIGSSGNPIILVSEYPGELHPFLLAPSSHFENIDIPIPSTEDRLEYIRWFASQQPGIELEVSPMEMAATTALLTRRNIEDIFLRGKRAGKITQAAIKERKAEIVKGEYGGILEVWETNYPFDHIAGNAHLKAYAWDSIIHPLRNGDIQRVDKGVLLMGPPGTGKSVFARAIAHESGVVAVKFDLAKIFDKYVGATERNLDKVLRALVAMSPMIVFLDEIDQMLQRVGEGEGSSASSHTFGRFLDFLGDESLRGKLVFVMATNRPDLVDAALKRDGRIDRKVVMPPPEYDEIPEYLTLLGSLVGLPITLDDISSAVMDYVKGWTGAELRTFVRKAWTAVHDAGLSVADALTYASTVIVATTQEKEKQMQLALAEVNDLSLLPESYRALVFRGFSSGETYRTDDVNSLSIREHREGF